MTLVATAPRARAPAPVRDVVELPEPGSLRDGFIDHVARQPAWAARRAVIFLFVWFLGGLILAAWNAASALGSFRHDLDDVRQALTEFDHDKAVAALDRARADLADGRANRGAAGMRLLAALPGTGRLLSSYDSVLLAGDDVFDAAGRATNVVDMIRGSPSRPGLLADGRIDFSVLDRARQEMVAGLASIDRAAARVATIDVPSFIPKLGSAQRRAAAQIAKVQAESKSLPAILDVLPSILGADGPRTYFLGFQNSAELRGSGGGLLSFALIKVDGGGITFERGGTIYQLDVEDPGNRPSFAFEWLGDDFWVQAMSDARRVGNANFSPNFPTAAYNITELYRIQSGGQTIDGVVAVTPELLARVLKVTGPIEVKGAPQPLSADTLVPFLLRDAYDTMDRDQRRAFNSELIDAVAQRVLKGANLGPLMKEMGDASRTRALQIYLSRAAEESVIRLTNLDGSLSSTTSDYGSFVENNAGGNKVDFFTKHRVAQSVRIGAEGEATIDVENVLRNDATPQDGPRQLGYQDRYADAILAAYIPERAIVDRWEYRGDAELNFGLAPLNREAGKLAVVKALEVKPGSQGELTVSYRLAAASVREADGTWTYRLVRQRQPRLDPDQFSVKVFLPIGAEPVDTAGWTHGDDGAWTRQGELVGTTEFVIRYRLG